MNTNVWLQRWFQVFKADMTSGFLVADAKHQFQLALDTGDPGRCWTKSSHDTRRTLSGSKLTSSTVLSIKWSGVITAQPYVWTSCPPHFAWTCPTPQKKRFTAACIHLASNLCPMFHLCSWKHVPIGTASALGLCQLGQTCHHTYQMKHHPIKKSWNWTSDTQSASIHHLIHDTWYPICIYFSRMCLQLPLDKLFCKFCTNVFSKLYGKAGPHSMTQNFHEHNSRS